MWKANWSTWHERRWDKENNLSPRQESNPWPPKHLVGALSTELRELMESKVVVWQAYCILLVSAVSKSDKWKNPPSLFRHLSKKYLVY